MMAVGPVGPEIMGTFIPKSPLNKHKNIAPYKPDNAPAPVIVPKASACGSAMVAPINPPIKSPDTFLIFIV